MDQAERKDTAQHALVYVGIGVGIVVLFVLLWYAIAHNLMRKLSLAATDRPCPA